ncbi:hypothetical protein DL96DRAFT_1588331 [Flagelloscypha sp. PMI_526]|nr:hypothetical protein DL96DRAFT_1588331 [Flagelloscypha sp. PMI_526]
MTFCEAALWYYVSRIEPRFNNFCSLCKCCSTTRRNLGTDFHSSFRQRPLDASFPQQGCLRICSSCLLWHSLDWALPTEDLRENVGTRLVRFIATVYTIVHTLHVHSNLDLGNQKPSGKHPETKGDVAKRLRFLKNRQQLFEKVVSNPNLRIDTLTVLCDEVILPHTHLIWRAVSHSLVHLELHFAHQSAYDALLSLSGNKRAYCPHLRSFVLIMGIGTSSFPIFYSIAQKRAYETPGYIFWNTHSSYASSRSTSPPNLGVLQSLLPVDLSSLGVHWLSTSQENKPQLLDYSFLHPEAYPGLRKLHISGLSMDSNASLSQFLLTRAPSLQYLTLENVSDAAGLFRRLPVTEDLEKLQLDQSSYIQLFEPASFQSGITSAVVRRYTHLRRLEIQGGSPSADEVFMLLVELGRGGSGIRELKLSLRTTLFKHLRAALLLLPKVTEMTLSHVGSCDPLMRQLSCHPLWIDLEDGWGYTVQFVELAHASGRLGPAVRRAMTAELRKGIDNIYAECISSLERKDALYSSIKMALKTTEAQSQGTIHLDAPAKDHRKVTLELIESCLVK